MIFKHFSKWKIDTINFNEIYSASWAESDYWKNKTLNDTQYDNMGNPVIESLMKVLKMLGKDFDVTVFGKELGKLKYYSELLKEYIFEGIRLDEFPEKPSRKNCMFLMPYEVNAKEYANKYGFDTGNLKFLEIETQENSIVHFADLTLLNCNSLTHNEKIENARNYWKGSINRDINTEILLSGDFRIVREIEC